jgi:hypothetical protein
MKQKFNVLYSSEILAYANANNYPGVKIGDVIELVEQDASYMSPEHRKQYGTIMLVERKIGEDIIGTIVVPGIAYVNDGTSLGDTYFNR